MTITEDGIIVNPGGNAPTGLNRKNLPNKDANPDPKPTPAEPGKEDSSDSKAGKGENIFTYDKLNRMVSSIDGNNGLTTYVYDALGNLITETNKNKVTDYRYNVMNQLVNKGTNSDNINFTYDKRGNLVRKDTKNKTETFVFDATNHMVKGTNEKGDSSLYTYNALFLRVNNTQVAKNGKSYSRDYVIDYNSAKRNELMVFAHGEYEQSHVYRGDERLLQVTNRGNGQERILYVHEDLRGTTKYYTKADGQVFEELFFDAWGMPTSTGKLLNNDHGNYITANYTGHNFDVVLGMYFAQARFYDAANRTWISRDQAKDGLNWYKYADNNPQTNTDPTGFASEDRKQKRQERREQRKSQRAERKAQRSQQRQQRKQQRSDQRQARKDLKNSGASRQERRELRQQQRGERKDLRSQQRQARSETRQRHRRERQDLKERQKRGDNGVIDNSGLPDSNPPSPPDNPMPDDTAPPSAPDNPAPAPPTLDDLVDQVIRGEWKNWPEREALLNAAGYDYRTVQDEVNRRLEGEKTAPQTDVAGSSVSNEASPDTTGVPPSNPVASFSTWDLWSAPVSDAQKTLDEFNRIYNELREVIDNGGKVTWEDITPFSNVNEKLIDSMYFGQFNKELGLNNEDAKYLSWEINEKAAYITDSTSYLDYEPVIDKAIHTGLDILSLYPPATIPAGAINIMLYAAQGQYDKAGDTLGWSVIGAQGSVMSAFPGNVGMLGRIISAYNTSKTVNGAISRWIPTTVPSPTGGGDGGGSRPR